MNHHLISCPIFAKELAAVLAEMSLAPAVHLMDYKVHLSSRDMEQELARFIRAAREGGEAISLLVGQECQAQQPISHIAENCHGRMPAEGNCIEIFLGRERARALQEKRTTIMTPGWIEMFNQSITEGFWTVEDARINLGWYDKILLLDPGIEPLSEELILEFFELTQVPIEILPVSLEHFKTVVHQLLRT
jgi:hypothetical protein